MPLPAIVLSGGASSRMGSPKALLTAGRETFLHRVTRIVLEAGLDEVIVVTGAHHDLIAADVAQWPASWPVRMIRNEAPGADQFASLRRGLDLIDHPGTAGVLVALVDHPFVSRETIEALVGCFRRTGAPVVRPRCAGRHGHPVIFARATFDAIRSQPHPSGAKAIVTRHADRAISLEVDDEGVVADLDTPADYAAALERFRDRLDA